jgi:TPP-dependent pyruvate/acetoin dehydrogenase alpha subunit
MCYFIFIFPSLILVYCVVWVGDGVVGKGQAYGMRSFRVDGNDALAVYATVKAARKMAVEESRPILIEVIEQPEHQSSHFLSS